MDSKSRDNMLSLAGIIILVCTEMNDKEMEQLNSAIKVYPMKLGNLLERYAQFSKDMGKFSASPKHNIDSNLPWHMMTRRENR